MSAPSLTYYDPVPILSELCARGWPEPERGWNADNYGIEGCLWWIEHGRSYFGVWFNTVYAPDETTPRHVGGYTVGTEKHDDRRVFDKHEDAINALEDLRRALAPEIQKRLNDCQQETTRLQNLMTEIIK